MATSRQSDRLCGVSREFVRSLFKDWDRENAPGGLVALEMGGESHYFEFGAADLANPRPWRTSSRFRIFGITKSFIGVLLLLAEDRKLLHLDDPVVQWLPEMQHLPRTVTLRHLATHTSGIRNNEVLQFLAGISDAAPLSFSYAMEVLCRQSELEFEPGSQMDYTDTDYRLLGEVLCRAWNSGLAELIDREISRKLNLADTLLLPVDGPVIPEMLTGYGMQPSGAYYSAVALSSTTGDGGIISSMRDMIAWCSALRNNSLEIQNLQERLAEVPALPNGQEGAHGIGLFRQKVSGVELLSAHGSWTGFSSFLSVAPEHDLAVIGLANFVDLELSRRFSALLEAAFAGSAPKGPAKKSKKMLPNLPNYPADGWYANTDLGEVLTVKTTPQTQFSESTKEVYISSIRGSMVPDRGGMHHCVFPYSSARARFKTDGHRDHDHPSQLEVVTAGSSLYKRVEPIYITSESIEELVGLYGSQSLNAIHRIFESDSRLWHMRGAGEWPDEQIREMQKVSTDLYVLDYPDRYFMTIRILRDEDDTVRSYDVSVRGAHNIAFEKLPDPIGKSVGYVDRHKLRSEEKSANPSLEQ